MSAHETYSLTMTPTYLPSRDAPETLAGQVTFLHPESGRIACRVEVRAAWEMDGEIETGTPEPPSLPGLSAEEIQERTRRFTAQFRDDKIIGVTDPDAPDRELDAVQASESWE